MPEYILVNVNTWDTSLWNFILVALIFYEIKAKKLLATLLNSQRKKKYKKHSRKRKIHIKENKFCYSIILNAYSKV